MYRRRLLKTVSPIYYPIGFNKDILDLIIDVEFEEDIHIPFSPLLTPFRKAFLEQLVELGYLRRRTGGSYVLETTSVLRTRLTGFSIREYEEASVTLRSSGREYRGFIIPSPWYFVKRIMHRGSRLLDDPCKALSIIPYLLSKIVREFTSLGLNTVLFVDIDSSLAKFFNKPSPPSPWNWSLLKQLLVRTIACCDAEKYIFMPCSKLHPILLSVIASSGVDMIGIDPRGYSVSELDKLLTINELSRLSIILAIVDRYFNQGTTIVKDLLKRGVFNIEYVSFSCRAWEDMLESGWSGIRRLIGLLKTVSTIII